MGLVERVRDHLRRRRWRRLMWVTAADVERALRQPQEPLAPKYRRVDYVLVCVHGDDFDRVAERIGRASELVADANGAFVNMTQPPLLLAVYSMLDEPPDAALQAEQRRALADRMGAELQSGASVLHGQADARIGDFGCARRASYCAALKGFREMLVTIIRDLKPGEVREWNVD
jgi:hypothetical protein